MKENTDKKVIVVTGNIGSGKTSVAKIVSAYFDYDFFKESVDQVVLNNFYQDMKKHGYNTQMHFLTTRFQDWNKMQLNNKSAVTDRYIDEDVEIFSRQLLQQGDLTPNDFYKIQKTKNNLMSNLNPPDLLVYLQTDVKIIMQRIAKRIKLNPKRIFEQDLLKPDNTYLKELNQHYESWFQNYDKGPKLAINTNSLILTDKEGRAPLYRKDIPVLIEQLKPYLT